MNKLSFILSSCFVFSFTVQAIEHIKVIDTQFNKSKDSLHISFRLEAESSIAARNYSVIITPQLSNQQNNLSLAPIYVETRTSNILSKRNKREKTAKSNTYGRNQEIAFEQSVPFASWMYDANLFLNIESQGCCKTIHYPFIVVDKPVLPTTHIMPAYDMTVELMPVFEEVTQQYDFGQENLIIDFRQSTTTIDTILFANSRTLHLILGSLDSIQSSGDMELSCIEITGYASPEGTTQFNKQLGEARAQALKNYIKKRRTTLKESDFQLNNGEVNWTGLEKMVQSSTMPYKDEVLHIIHTVPAAIDLDQNTSRKKQLMDLKGGVPYNYMYTHFFPKLRNACYISVYYKQATDSNVEIINQAIRLIQSNKYSDAINQLLPIRSDARTWNLIGVAYMMMKDFENATDYFQKAILNKDTLAEKNLSQIKAFVLQ